MRRPLFYREAIKAARIPDDDLSGAERQVLIYTARRQKHTGADAAISPARIATADHERQTPAGFTERTYRRALASLIERGALIETASPRGRRPGRYALRRPEPTRKEDAAQ